MVIVVTSLFIQTIVVWYVAEDKGPSGLYKLHMRTVLYVAVVRGTNI